MNKLTDFEEEVLFHLRILSGKTKTSYDRIKEDIDQTNEFTELRKKIDNFTKVIIKAVRNDISNSLDIGWHVNYFLENDLPTDKYEITYKAIPLDEGLMKWTVKLKNESRFLNE